MKTIEFFIHGTPKPGGSKTATLVRNRNGSPRMVQRPGGGSHPIITVRDASNSGDWKTACKAAALDAYRGEPIRAKALVLTVQFNMPRPQSHFRTGKRAGELKPDAPAWHINKPDATKLTRCLEDALTGILWADDTIIAVQHISKPYANVPGARVTITEVHP